MIAAIACLLLAAEGAEQKQPAEDQQAINEQLLRVRRVFVDKLNGGEPALQIRDMLISSLQASGLFLLTENPERADAILRGSAEDLIYTDTFASSESLDARASLGRGGTTSRSSTAARGISVSVGEDESTRIAERKHEAVAAVRLVDKNGDILWSTTQESTGAKFRGASADVADKVTRQLVADVQKAKRKPSPAPKPAP
jgi:hypothetical protein